LFCTAVDLHTVAYLVAKVLQPLLVAGAAALDAWSHGPATVRWPWSVETWWCLGAAIRGGG